MAENQPQGNDELFIVELDERLEFGVAAIYSTFHPDANSNCQNGVICSSDNTGNCYDGANCHQ